MQDTLARQADRYTARLNSNRLTSWLHGRRHAHARQLVVQLAEDLGRPIQVLDIGCGPGTLSKHLPDEAVSRYIGLDHSEGMLPESSDRDRYILGAADDPGVYATLSSIDMVFALEVLEHMDPDVVTRTLDCIASKRPRYFIASVPVETGPSVFLKNFGSWLMGYWRGNEYTWRYTLYSSLYMLSRVPPHDEGWRGHMGFSWRKMEKTLRTRFRIWRRINLPLAGLPLASNVLWIMRPH